MSDIQNVEVKVRISYISGPKFDEPLLKLLLKQELARISLGYSPGYTGPTSRYALSLVGEDAEGA